MLHNRPPPRRPPNQSKGGTAIKISSNTLKGIIQSSTIWGPLIALSVFITTLNLMR